MKFTARRFSRKSKSNLGFGYIPSGFFSFPPTRFVPRQLGFRKKEHKVYGSIGDLEVRLATTRVDVRRAQKLRYRVFYREMSAIADATTMMTGRDVDAYDPICDHLLVVDKGNQAKTFTSLKKRPWPIRSRVVGTYRILRQEVAELYNGFYTQSEFDIASLIEKKRGTHKFLELGRSCVLKSFRTKRTMELLWQGIWNYVQEHGDDVLIGCASFPGTDPQQHALAMSFLYHHAMAPEEWRVKAHDRHYVDMNMMPKSDIDLKKAMRAMPPLIKGYLRMGAYFGDGAVVDHQFGTTDVLIVLPMTNLDTKYSTHFGSRSEKQNKEQA